MRKKTFGETSFEALETQWVEGVKKIYASAPPAIIVKDQFEDVSLKIAPTQRSKTARSKKRKEVPFS
jgi:hypothetical protein